MKIQISPLFLVISFVLLMHAAFITGVMMAYSRAPLPPSPKRMVVSTIKLAPKIKQEAPKIAIEKNSKPDVEVKVEQKPSLPKKEKEKNPEVIQASASPIKTAIEKTTPPSQLKKMIPSKPSIKKSEP